MTAVEHVLTGTELDRLADLEATISVGLRTFVEVGTALAEVRDARLYRAEHGTFEEYCFDRWSMSDRRARQLMTAAEVVSEVAATGTVVPGNESQARALSLVRPEHRTKVWAKAVKDTGGKPTAAAVTQAAVAAIDEHWRGVYAERPEPPAEPLPPKTVRVATREQQDERDRETSDRAASRSLARCVWTLATNDLLVDAADNYVRIWRDDEDVYPEPTTAERMRIAARLLNDLADRWHR